MIKVNLLGKKKAFKVPVILGMDPTKLNIKMLFVVFIIYLAPGYTLYPVWDDDTQAAKDRVDKARKKLKVIRKKVNDHANVKIQLEAFNEQVERLKERSKLVNGILKEKRHPNFLLERIARDIPKKVWLEDLQIDYDRNITIIGKALSYKAIGEFREKVNKSSYFENSLYLKSSSTIAASAKNNTVRVEKFEITGKVASFDLWSQ